MNKNKSIQISQSLFLDLVKYHLLDCDDVSEPIKKGLNLKIDNIIKHELYTKYKTALSEKEKDEARKAYLDKVGISESFRW
ncbi:MAG: complexin-2 [Paludibacteraceae bacterium]